MEKWTEVRRRVLTGELSKRAACQEYGISWLTATHTVRWHHAHRTVGTGLLCQGRIKSFPIASDEHFLTVCRYVERNALRANLAGQAEDWRWSGL
jgi:putative transposase